MDAAGETRPPVPEIVQGEALGIIYSVMEAQMESNQSNYQSFTSLLSATPGHQGEALRFNIGVMDAKLQPAPTKSKASSQHTTKKAIYQARRMRFASKLPLSPGLRKTILLPKEKKTDQEPETKTSEAVSAQEETEDMDSAPELAPEQKKVDRACQTEKVLARVLAKEKILALVLLFGLAVASSLASMAGALFAARQE